MPLDFPTSPASGTLYTEGQLAWIWDTISWNPAYTTGPISIDSNTMGVVYHGATAGTARPVLYSIVTWIGSVQPTNAVNNDVWINTA